MRDNTLMYLFDHAMNRSLATEAPLAARMRLLTLEEYVGQEHILGEGKILREAIVGCVESTQGLAVSLISTFTKKSQEQQK